MLAKIESFEADTRNGTYRYGLFMVTIIAMAIPLAGALQGWNIGAVSGFWTCFCSNIVIGLLYFFLVLCYGELCSAVPFSGGAFGYSRCANGPFIGFVVGMSELLQYFAFEISNVMVCAANLTIVLNTSPSIEPVYYLVIYIVMFFALTLDPRWLWNFMIVCAILTVLPVLLFICGAFPTFNNELVEDNVHDRVHRKDLMEYVLISSTFLYVGIEILPQTCTFVRNPEVTIPRGLVLGCIFSIILSSLVIVGFIGVEPKYGQDLADQLFPFTIPLKEFYNISARASSVFSLPSTICVAFSIMFSCGHQMLALAKSGILPKFMSKTAGPADAPYVCLAISSVLQMIVAVVIYNVYPTFNVYNLMMFAGIFVYYGIFAAFIAFRVQLRNIHREWSSPFGTVGAVFGILLNTLLLIAMMGYMEQPEIVAIYFVFMLLSLIYYYFVAKDTQFFSEEEQEKFFKAYVTNANKYRRSRKSTFMRRFGLWSLPSRIHATGYIQSTSSMNSPSLNDGGLETSSTHMFRKFSNQEVIPPDGPIVNGSIANDSRDNVIVLQDD